MGIPSPGYRRNRNLYAFLGFLLGLGAPLGWLASRFVFTQLPLLAPWFKNEWAQFGPTYTYMAFSTVMVFAIFGYYLGELNDAAEQEANNVRETMNKVNEMAMTDALTGLNNARYLHDHLAVEMESAKRYQTPLTCLLFDIDDFKRVNDRYGHPYGDIVLITLAKIVLQCIRKADILGRLGGEEFLLVMPHTSSETAFSIAERIRFAVARQPFMVHEAKIPITISIGTAWYPGPGVTDKDSLLKAADDALYEAKRAGKNRTMISKRNQLSLI